MSSHSSAKSIKIALYMYCELIVFAGQDPEISYDYQNGTAGDADPSPVYGKPTTPNSHGTRCAGEIAMAANNRVGTGWAAPSGRIGGFA